MSAELRCSLPLLLTFLCTFPLCVLLTPSLEPLFSPRDWENSPCPSSSPAFKMEASSCRWVAWKRGWWSLLGVMKPFQGAASREQGVRTVFPGWSSQGCHVHRELALLGCPVSLTPFHSRCSAHTGHFRQAQTPKDFSMQPPLGGWSLNHSLA